MGIYKSYIFLTAHTSEIQPFLGLGDLSTTPTANTSREQEAQKLCGSELCGGPGASWGGHPGRVPGCPVPAPASPTPSKCPFDKAVLAHLLENSDNVRDLLPCPFSFSHVAVDVSAKRKESAVKALKHNPVKH